MNDMTQSRSEAGSGSITTENQNSDAHLISTLKGIERFVDEVIKDGRPVYVYKPGTQCLPKRRILKREMAFCIEQLKMYISAYREHHAYNPSCNLFFQSVIHLGWPDIVSTNPDVLVTESLTFGEFVNALVSRIHERVNSRAFKEKLRKEESDRQERLIDYQSYIGDLFDSYARLLVIRIDLSYRPEIALHQPEMLARLRQDLAKLKDMMSSRSFAFSGLVGFISVIEYGTHKGHHVHLILLYDGSKHQKDVYIASEVGSLWQALSKGDGQFHNCNAEKNKYRKLGIGMINHFEHAKIEVLTEIALPYLFKTVQLLSYKTSRKMKRFSRGKSPRLDISAMKGRPRVH